MKSTIHVKETFTNLDYAGKAIPAQKFDTCTFLNCDFSKTDLSGFDFIDCNFSSCNFSNARLIDTGLKHVVFSDCKLLGVDFSRCRDFLLSFGFERCILDYVSFSGKKIRKTIFRDCSIKEADFADADLAECGFLNCDLSRTVFQLTNLEKADLRTAMNFSIDPENNRIKRAIFSADGIAGLLDKYQIIIE